MFTRTALLALSFILSALLPHWAMALDFRSIAVPKAVLYDAPSFKANKTFILNQDYPVEVIVNLGAWVKVRDAQGSLNWIEANALSTKRILLVVKNCQIQQSAEESSAKLATVEKDVLLDFVAIDANASWVLVRHKNGIQGYVPSSLVWGL